MVDGPNKDDQLTTCFKVQCDPGGSIWPLKFIWINLLHVSILTHLCRNNFEASKIETKPPHISSVNRKHLSLSYLQTKIIEFYKRFFRNHPRNLQETKKREISLLPGCIPISPKHNNNKFLNTYFPTISKHPVFKPKKNKTQTPILLMELILHQLIW